MDFKLSLYYINLYIIIYLLLFIYYIYYLLIIFHCFNPKNILFVLVFTEKPKDSCIFEPRFIIIEGFERSLLQNESVDPKLFGVNRIYIISIEF